MKYVLLLLAMFSVTACCKPQIKYVDKITYVGNEIQIVPEIPERNLPTLDETEKNLTKADLEAIMAIINNLKTENKLLREQIRFYRESIKKNNASVKKNKK